VRQKKLSVSRELRAYGLMTRIAVELYDHFPRPAWRQEVSPQLMLGKAPPDE
jgi:hypothetical protein